MLTTLLILLGLTSQSFAEDLKMRGTVQDEDQTLKGKILFEGEAITVQKKSLLKTRTVSYNYGDIKSLQTERGLFAGVLLLKMDNGRTVNLTVRGGGKAKRAEETLRDRLRG